MPRALSNAEFVQFTSDYPQYNAFSSSFNMSQGQSAVVNWNNTGQIVLVYDAFDTITVNDNLYPDVYYTDVTDATQALAIQQPGYTSPPQTMLNALSQATKDTLAEDAQSVGALANSAGTTLASYVSPLVAGAASAAQSVLVPVLIGAVFIFLFMYGPRSS